MPNDTVNLTFVIFDSNNPPSSRRGRPRGTTTSRGRTRARGRRTTEIPRAPRSRSRPSDPNGSSTNDMPPSSESSRRDDSLNRACHNFFEEANILRERTQDINKNAESPTYGRHLLLPMVNECPHCKAILFKGEMGGSNSEYSFCCSNGKVNIPTIPMPPILIQKLLTGDHPASTEFRTNIRIYNNAFAFTSIGADNVDEHFSGSNQGSYSFRIQGGTYHQIAPLLSGEGRKAAFAQIYFSDPNLQVQQRLDFNTALDREVVSQLHDLMKNTFYGLTFKNARERTLNQNSGTEQAEKDLYVYIRGNPSLGRTYDVPTADEVAAFIVDANEPDHVNQGGREVVAFQIGTGFPKKMNDCHASFDALHFALMFPGGEDGWTVGIQLSLSEEDVARNEQRDIESTSSNRFSQKTVSLNQFYNHRLQTRPNISMLCHFGRLFHLYIVDMYCKIESRRLYFLRTQQNLLRTELYSGLADAQVTDTMDEVSIGKRVILPASYTGSPRAMHELQQDAMAVVRALGNPDYFITITTNPNWKEITDELLPGEKPSDRPDLIARVFDLKLKAIFKDIEDKKIFGNVQGLIHVIEYQKRGLPHAHVVLILAPDSKLRNAEDVDKYISAEIPDPVRYPNSHATVTKHMMHTPCNTSLTDNRGKVRMCRANKDKSCSKHFPKAISETTIIDEKGFANYRRRPTSLFVPFSNGYRADNRWVVPHNLYLCVKYDTHINVEFCAGNAAIKYLFKYICKGSDRAQVALKPAANTSSSAPTNNSAMSSDTAQVNEVDEISTWRSVRYISTIEACWRIFGKRTHSCSPSIKRLAVHLKDQQNVTYVDGASGASVRRTMEKETTLTAFFKLNEDNESDPEFVKHVYTDIPKYYTQHSKTKCWVKRSNSQTYPAIGRMHYVPATDIERYCLRLLLLHVKGPTSFKNLRTTDTFEDDGVTFSFRIEWASFREAAQALGLLKDGKEWDRAMIEAHMLCNDSSRVRELFTVLLIFNFVHNYKEIWDKHIDILSMDFERSYRNEMPNNDRLTIELSEQDYKVIYNNTIIDISNRLLKSNKSITNFPELPQPDPSTYDHFTARAQNLYEQEIGQYNVDDLAINVVVYEDHENGLNSDQRSIYDEIISAIYDDDSLNFDKKNFFFIDGPGGTGKTFLYHALLCKVRSNGHIALACASSGIAATLLPGGKTAHSLFQIPIDFEKSSVCNIKMQDVTAKIIFDAKLILWDEAPMTNKKAFESVNDLLQEIMGNTLPFGGKVVVLGGDFRQTLPIIKLGTRADIVGACITNSYLFSDCRTLRLTRNMRVNTDSILPNGITFQDFLLQVGEGHEQGEKDTVVLPSSMVTYADSNEKIVDEVFGDSLSDPSLYTNRDFFIDKAILASHNDTVDEINVLATEKLEGTNMEYLSEDSIDKSEAPNSNFPVEYLNSLKPSGMPPHKLILKRYQPIMCLRNINPAEGLCNGTRMICRNFTRNIIEAEIAIGDNAGKLVLIPRITLLSNDNSTLPFELRRRQFPVQPAFAMTINKAQGQTLTSVTISLTRPVFTHGQLYVALSRVRNPSNVKVYLQNNATHNQQPTTSTSNIVFTEVLT